MNQWKCMGLRIVQECMHMIHSVLIISLGASKSRSNNSFHISSLSNSSLTTTPLASRNKSILVTIQPVNYTKSSMISANPVFLITQTQRMIPSVTSRTVCLSRTSPSPSTHPCSSNIMIYLRDILKSSRTSSLWCITMSMILQEVTSSSSSR